MTVAYSDHNKECRLVFVGRISSCELVLYVFGGPKRKMFLFYITILKRACGLHISEIFWNKGILSILIKDKCFDQVSGFVAEFSKLKEYFINTHDG